MAQQDIKRYLDKLGLTEYDGKIKALLQDYKDQSTEYTDEKVQALDDAVDLLLEGLPSVAYKTIVAGSINVIADAKDNTLNLSAGSGISLAGNNSTKTVTISSAAFKGATSSAAGTLGAVPAPSSGSTGLFLKSSGAWAQLAITDVANLQTSLNEKYVKAVTGIPKTDLESSVQDALDLASTSLQSIGESTGTGTVITALSLSEDGKSIIPSKGITPLTASSVTNKSATLAYGSSTTVATIGGKDITLTLPSLGSVGGTTQPIYFSSGKPVATTYTLGANVPSGAIFTDEKVTSSANHYTPETVTSSALTATASSTTSASWGTTSILTGFTISRDTKGHITDLSCTSVTLPLNPLASLKAGTGLSFSSNTINHSNSITSGTASDGGATRTLNFAGTFKIPSITYDAQGHITSTSSITLTLPNIRVNSTALDASALNLVAGTNVTLTSSSGNVTITSKDTTYTLSSGTNNGTLKLTPSSGSAIDNIAVTGLKALAYKASLSYSELTGGMDASKITSGTISIDRLPSAALERCVVVTTEANKLALTSADIQVGDTVKVTSTKKMYMVVDTSKLGTEDAFTEYVTSSDWSAITSKPTTVSGYGLTDVYTKAQTDSVIETAIGNAIAASY